MLNIPESVKTLFKTDGTRKNFRVQFPNGEFPDITNENIVRESLHFTESLCSQSTFRFGLAEASVLEYETVGIGNMYGMTINASIEIDLSSLTASEIADIEAGTWDGEYVALADSDLGFPYFRVPLGVFQIKNCPRDHSAMTHRKVTAYSNSQIQSDPDEKIPGTPSEIAFFPNYEADFTGILAAGRDGASLTKFGEVVYTSVGACRTFFNSSGTQYEVDLLNSTGINDHASVQGYVFRGTTYPTDFIRVGNFDAAAYYAQGETIAALLDSAGYDLTYNSAQKKIYDSNKDALLANMPYLFYPTLFLDAIPANGQWTSGGVAGTQIPLAPNSLVAVPVAGSELVSVDDRLFRLKGWKTGGYYAYVQTIDTSEATALRVRVNVYEGSGSYLPISDGYKSAPPTVELYTGTASGMAITVTNTGALPARSAVAYYNGTYKSQNMPMYSFVNTIKYPSLVTGIYETFGRFGKSDRLGGIEDFALPTTTPVDILPEDYSELWWDEYDVSPIGSVSVIYKSSKNEDISASITIGRGGSVYDMSDNEVLKNLKSATLSSLTTLLKGQFKTNAAKVGFTPIELNMQGWPWIEAGDYLKITAEDGTIVKSYALRVEMTGIQYLSMMIAADGGEIVGEV